MLSPDEYEAIAPLLAPLPRAIRDDFVAAVASALDGSPAAGPGFAYRIARQLLPRFFRPPEPTPGPEYFNARKSR